MSARFGASIGVAYEGKKKVVHPPKPEVVAPVSPKPVVSAPVEKAEKKD